MAGQESAAFLVVAGQGKCSDKIHVVCVCLGVSLVSPGVRVPIRECEELQDEYVGR